VALIEARQPALGLKVLIVLRDNARAAADSTRTSSIDFDRV